jgi:hypothetical protein
MSDIAIRVENCILSGGRQPGVEGLSKLYPAVAPRARHLGGAQSRAGDSLGSQRHDTLRGALASVFSRQSSVGSRQSRLTTDNSELKTDNSLLSRITEPMSGRPDQRPRRDLRRPRVGSLLGIVDAAL